MPQDVLDAEVALATGEELDMISRHGFVPLTFGPVELEHEDFHEPQVVDWDQLDLERNVSIFP
jgi:isopentenyl phosphate kinase